MDMTKPGVIHDQKGGAVVLDPLHEIAYIYWKWAH